MRKPSNILNKFVLVRQSANIFICGRLSQKCFDRLSKVARSDMYPINRDLLDCAAFVFVHLVSILWIFHYFHAAMFTWDCLLLCSAR